MGSVGSPNAWTPYDTYRDCAQGICNAYCPQWCYYPPPDSGDDNSGTTFSPLIIAVIGILASAFLLVSYYAIITKYCRRRRSRNPDLEVEALRTEISRDQWQVSSSAGAGLDETLINSITVFKYKKGDKLVEGSECSVCLNEFEENENLRLMPKCCHAFHPSCIDVWLKSHSNCPLCRANAAPIYTLPTPNPAPAAQSSSAVNISALQIHQPDDLIFVVEARESISHNQELFVSDDFLKSPLQSNSTRSRNQEEERQIRRSNSLGALSVADILRIEEDDEGLRMEIRQLDEGNSTTGRNQEELVRSSAAAAVKRSFSTGRFNFHKAS